MSGQLYYGGGALVDMTSNQNAPSTKGADSDWLMGISTKATSNQIPSVLKVPILIGGILSLQCQACYKTQKADSFTTRPTGENSHSVLLHNIIVELVMHDYGRALASMANDDTRTGTHNIDTAIHQTPFDSPLTLQLSLYFQP